MGFRHLGIHLLNVLLNLLWLVLLSIERLYDSCFCGIIAMYMKVYTSLPVSVYKSLVLLYIHYAVSDCMGESEKNVFECKATDFLMKCIAGFLQKDLGLVMLSYTVKMLSNVQPVNKVVKVVDIVVHSTLMLNLYTEGSALDTSWKIVSESTLRSCIGYNSQRTAYLHNNCIHNNCSAGFSLLNTVLSIPRYKDEFHHIFVNQDHTLHIITIHLCIYIVLKRLLILYVTIFFFLSLTLHIVLLRYKYMFHLEFIHRIFQFLFKKKATTQAEVDELNTYNSQKDSLDKLGSLTLAPAGLITLTMSSRTIALVIVTCITFMSMCEISFYFYCFIVIFSIPIFILILCDLCVIKFYMYDQVPPQFENDKYFTEDRHSYSNIFKRSLLLLHLEKKQLQQFYTKIIIYTIYKLYQETFISWCKGTLWKGKGNIAKTQQEFGKALRCTGQIMEILQNKTICKDISHLLFCDKQLQFLAYLEKKLETEFSTISEYPNNNDSTQMKKCATGETANLTSTGYPNSSQTEDTLPKEQHTMKEEPQYRCFTISAHSCGLDNMVTDRVAEEDGYQRHGRRNATNRGLPFNRRKRNPIYKWSSYKETACFSRSINRKHTNMIPSQIKDNGCIIHGKRLWIKARLARVSRVQQYSQEGSVSGITDISWPVSLPGSHESDEK